MGRTRPRRFARELLPLHLSALSYAKDKLGVTESYVNGRWTNWGPEVQAFLFAANIKVPAPWCAGFVNWCAEEAAYDKQTTSTLEDVPLQAYVQSYADWAEIQDRFITKFEAGPGDLFILYYTSLGRYGHIGFVIEVNEEEGWFTTVEGNTNDEASREGFKVATRRRAITDRVKFIRWA